MNLKMLLGSVKLFWVILVLKGMRKHSGDMHLQWQNRLRWMTTPLSFTIDGYLYEHEFNMIPFKNEITLTGTHWLKHIPSYIL
jgi:hypothetical protein